MGLRENMQSQIAIIGVAAELPSGSYSHKNLDYKSFSEFLSNKGEAYEDIPSERFNSQSWSGHGLGQVTATRGAFLKDVGMFDHVEFGISAKDARAMAVSTRKLIELSFLSLLDSGIDYRGQNVGCYASGTAFDILSVAEPDELETKGSFSGIPCMIANKISYHLDLRGPSIPVDTACSSSLTALHLAVQALRAGECEAAVVGGCQLNLRVMDFILYSQGSILAPDGKCKPFDSGANGFSKGEGAVVVVLKPYDDAVRDGDHIYGTILGTGLSATGSPAPAYAPVANAQADAMRRAYRSTGHNPRDVDFVEVHATGTAAGDLIEANWVGENFGRNEELLIGSVKGNIGHLEITAFLASLCKILSIFESRIIPANVNLIHRNPAIRWDDYRLRVPLEATRISPRAPSGKFLMSMCSSGIGGANGHVVLESPSPKLPCQDESVRGGPILLVVGGLSPRSCTAIADATVEIIGANPDQWSSLSTISGRRARQMTWRTFAVARPDREELHLMFPAPTLSPKVKPPVVFVFSGQGPQHIHMGRQLYAAYPVFRLSILALDEHYQKVTGVSLVQKWGLFTGDGSSSDLPDVWPIAVILPALAMVQMAMFDLLRSFGLVPNLLVGHSAGETALLYASGAGTKEMALEIAIARGQTMTLVESAQGTMAALACSPAHARSLIHSVLDGGSGTEGILEIACFNAPDAVTIAGLEYFVDKSVAAATQQGYFARKIRTRVAVHSSMLDAWKENFRAAISSVYSRHPGDHTPKILTYSTYTGEVLDWFTEEYFWHNTRYPVLFSQAAGQILRAHPSASFVEISPHPALSSYLQALGALASSVVCPMHRLKVLEDGHEQMVLLAALGQVIVLGHNTIDFRVLNDRQRVDRGVDLSPYPFAKKPVPYFPESSRVLQKQFAPRNGPLNYLDLRLNHHTHPELAQHVIKGEPVMPAAGFLEMALELGARVLWDVQFHAILSLSSETPVPVEMEVDELHWSITSRSGVAAKYGEPDRAKRRVHAEGYMSRQSVEGLDPIDISAIRNRCDTLKMEGFYNKLQYFAQYGPVYQRATEVYIGASELLVKVKGGDADLPGFENYIIHPAVLDACFHAIVHPDFTSDWDRNAYYLPSQVGAFVLHNRLLGEQAVVYAHVTLKEWLPDQLTVDIQVTSDNGATICTLHDLVAQRHFSTSRKVAKRYDVLHQPLGIRSLDPYAPRHDVETMPKRTSSFSSNNTSSNDFTSTTLSPPQVNGTHQNGLDASPPHVSILSEVEEVCRNFLTQAIEGCGKKVVRILGIDDGSNALHQCLVSLLSSMTNCDAIYFAAAKDLSDVSEHLKASFVRSLPLDISLSMDQQGVAEGSFDVVVGLQVLASRITPHDDVRKLSTLLVPGGLLVLTEPGLTGSIEAATACSHSTTAVSQDPDVPALFQSSSSKWKAFLGFLKATQSDSPHGLQEGTHIGLVTLLGQSPSISLQPPATPSPLLPRELLILSYTVGQEIALQSAIRKFNIDAAPEVWFTSTQGIDADAARGFTRSLRRELPLWNVFLVIFHESHTPAERNQIVRQISAIPGMEPEVVVDDNCQILVPRFYESSGPSPMGGLGQVLPTWGAMDVEVEVIATVPSVARIHGVVGRVTRVTDDSHNYLLDSTVVSVVADSPGKTVLLHKGAVATLDANVYNLDVIATLAPAFFIAGLALSSSIIRDSSRILSGRLILMCDDSPFTQALSWVFSTLRVQHLEIASNASPLDLRSLHLRTGDVVVCPHNGHNGILQTFVRDGIRVVKWGSDLASTLTSDPWFIGDALQALVAKTRGYQMPKIQEPLAPSTFMSKTLFEPDAAYLLVGGIGSLGVQVSRWMYEKGARHIVLTSRSGLQSLERAGDKTALRTLAYLETREDLSLRLETSDASSSVDMKRVVAGITRPIAGCMLLATVYADRSFFSQTASSFEMSFKPKLGALQALEMVLDLNKMDFLISFSSIATVGNAGQVNYASANTALDGAIRKYRNAFSLVAPAITDSAVVTGRADSEQDPARLQHLLSWGFSTRELCDCIEDGIMKLADGPFGLYIPDLDWDQVQKHLGPSQLYDHLVQNSSESTSLSLDDSSDVLRDIVLQFVDVQPEEFSADIPLTSYGLDSLTAGRLSLTLRPLLVISQLQLLGDLTLDDLRCRVDEKRELQTADAQSDLDNIAIWEGLNDDGKPLVKLVDVGGTPFILMHGGAGSIPFLALQQSFTTSLWALQTTPITPMQSVDSMARFYYEQIKAEQGRGPYRLGCFSGTNIILFALARLFEENGDRVVQFLIIDHFPLLFTPALSISNEVATERRTPSLALIRYALATAVTLLKTSGQQRQLLGDHFEDAMEGRTTHPFIERLHTNFHDIMVITYDFIFDLLPVDDPVTMEAARRALTRWMRNLKAPVTVCFASDGVRSTIPEAEGLSDDGGVREAFPDARVVEIEANHFSIMESDTLVDVIQTGWAR
ncbi:putative polyketide synthase [Hygrophoropsis aurantiaca]|uniref:Polyketide synthase n=1 Tax=Hygrophoropsis aurantiaca TaxID=72124 RepID=A0ACB8A2W7_9AGAM|nr:putative polyketide synthase [Hygrophoropsis aurantiaca]